MPINRERIRRHLRNLDFKSLLSDINWAVVNAKPQPIPNQPYAHRQIAEMNGVRIYEIIPQGAPAALPDSKTRAVIHTVMERQQARENLLIFCDAPEPDQRTQSLWYWVKRDGTKKQPREHTYFKGQPGDLFLSKLDSLFINMDELRDDGTIPLADAIGKLSTALDVERVTKKFYTEFSTLRVEFIDLIEGIEREADRFWYASVLLNRLMFVYFLQKRGFIQKNTRYLDDKLNESKARGADRFYGEFLKALFFQGFALPPDKRTPEAKALLGDIRYLNGGLFLPHQLEIQYPGIRIPDDAFENVLALFGRYSWHLDDTPGAQDNEINPDVLGYIFEKYINQKAFGAYYTRGEITQYLCERTISAVIVDKVNAISTRQYADMGEILLNLDTEVCRKLLAILPTLSILDPACGSGAFLVAAMKTLLDVYAAVYGKIRFLSDTNLTAHLREIDQQHPSINYYIRKRIITDNLYGVDIMEEATEIARLRLFLFLVSSAQTVEQLEPLPNIDFNIMCGNSLIGLLSVDATRFDKNRQMDMFQEGKAAQYRDLLSEKNRLIGSYRYASTLVDDLRALREQINTHKERAYTTLDAILLDDFHGLKIQYEQAQADGKAKKRPLTLADIRALEPFHWGYEFDEIMGTRGGFDVIITNPPWETFQVDSKEFLAEYSDVISKKKMRIEDFDKEKERLLKDPDVEKAWLEYQSRFPHQREFYRLSPQYKNQFPVIDGRKHGKDVNLYKLFVEQCFALLRRGGMSGLVIPSGIYTDLGAKQLREMLFTQTGISGLFCFENRKMIFEGVDSRFKFVVLTYRKGGHTDRFPSAFMRHDVAELDHFPSNESLMLSVEMIRKTSPDSLSIMEFKSDTDVWISEKMLRFPLLGEDVREKWQATIYREFNMTDDSYLFRNERALGRLPLYEGKMIWQFDSHYADPRYWVDEKEGRKASVGKRGSDKGQRLSYQEYRLGFRDIAASTNERTLISSIIPRTFHGNKIPALVIFDDDGKRLISDSEQIYLCCVWNSFVVDWSIRQRVTTTINYFYLYQTPIPRLTSSDPYFAPLVERAARLICTTPEFDDLAREVGIRSHAQGVTDVAERARLRAEIDGMVAHLYGLTEDDFTHILGTFPLVGEAVKAAALQAYRDVGAGKIG